MSTTMKLLLALRTIVPVVQKEMSPVWKKMLFQISKRHNAAKTAALLTALPSIAMPTLPKNFAAVRAAVASVLLSPVHRNKLYGAVDIAAALNTAANIDRNASITKKVDVTMLLRAFAHPDPEFMLNYGACFGWEPGGDVLYIRRPIRTARGDAGILAIGRFSLVDVAKRANFVGWRVNMDDDVRAKLINYLEEASRSKPSKKKRKRAPTDVAPDNTNSTRNPSRRNDLPSTMEGREKK